MGRVQAQTLPVFRDGQAQVVPGFNDATRWIRHDLWVETEFDSDGDGNICLLYTSPSPRDRG